MVTIDIKENIRFFKPNDPYYYEVDNLPLIDLLNNDKILRDEIDLILAADTNYASESYVQTNIQAAIGSAAEVDIDGDGITPAFTDLISWINAQGYLTSVTTKLEELEDVDVTSNLPGPGDALIYDGTLTKWVPGNHIPDTYTLFSSRKHIVGTAATSNSRNLFQTAGEFHNKVITGNSSTDNAFDINDFKSTTITVTKASLGIPDSATFLDIEAGCVDWLDTGVGPRLAEISYEIQGFLGSAPNRVAICNHIGFSGANQIGGLSNYRESVLDRGFGSVNNVLMPLKSGVTNITFYLTYNGSSQIGGSNVYAKPINPYPKFYIVANGYVS